MTSSITNAASGMDSVQDPAQGTTASSRGQRWLTALTGGPGQAVGTIRSVRYADAPLGGERARYIAVVPDPNNHFPRARGGEVGLEEGWSLAKIVRDVMAEGRDGDDAARRPIVARPIVAIVDVSSQAYGRREELMGVHMACAAAANAYADALLDGHPVLALIVGKAMSGAFLAHGYQANRMIALDDPGVLVHAMGQAAAARVTRRSVEQLKELGDRIPPMSYDIKNYAKLGLLDALLEGIDADAPDATGIDRVTQALVQALTRIRESGTRDLSIRHATDAGSIRTASNDVRKRLADQW